LCDPGKIGPTAAAEKTSSLLAVCCLPSALCLSVSPSVPFLSSHCQKGSVIGLCSVVPVLITGYLTPKVFLISVCCLTPTYPPPQKKMVFARMEKGVHPSPYLS